jgi:flagellar biosynthetic protein FlhB
VPEESLQEKTEKATPKKRQKAREEGRVARSIELPSVFVLLAGVILLFFMGHTFRIQFLELMRTSFSIESIPRIDIHYCIVLLHNVASRYFSLMLPIMGIVVSAAVVFNLFQVGFHISFKPIQPKVDRFNIIQGVKRLVSVKSLAELIKSVLKLLVIGFVAYAVIETESHRFPHLYHLDVSGILVFILKAVFKIFIGILLVMVIIAVVDYAFQRWQFDKSLRMTKQEVKEEHKQTEGDPQVKARIRSIQQQAARRRMLHQVPEADVVVTNPAHLALAIGYDPATMGAPQLVAKGAGLVAERIREVASVHGIPVVENRKLAQNLYRLVKIGEEIPAQLYKAVAELLAYVYNLRGKTV